MAIIISGLDLIRTIPQAVFDKSQNLVDHFDAAVAELSKPLPRYHPKDIESGGLVTTFLRTHYEMISIYFLLTVCLLCGSQLVIRLRHKSSPPRSKRGAGEVTLNEEEQPDTLSQSIATKSTQSPSLTRLATVTGDNWVQTLPKPRLKDQVQDQPVRGRLSKGVSFSNGERLSILKNPFFGPIQDKSDNDMGSWIGPSPVGPLRMVPASQSVRGGHTLTRGKRSSLTGTSDERGQSRRFRCKQNMHRKDKQFVLRGNSKPSLTHVSNNSISTTDESAGQVDWGAGKLPEQTKERKRISRAVSSIPYLHSMSHKGSVVTKPVKKRDRMIPKCSPCVPSKAHRPTNSLSDRKQQVTTTKVITSHHRKDSIRVKKNKKKSKCKGEKRSGMPRDPSGCQYAAIPRCGDNYSNVGSLFCFTSDSRPAREWYSNQNKTIGDARPCGRPARNAILLSVEKGHIGVPKRDLSEDTNMNKSVMRLTVNKQQQNSVDSGNVRNTTDDKMYPLKPVVPMSCRREDHINGNAHIRQDSSLVYKTVNSPQKPKPSEGLLMGSVFDKGNPHDAKRHHLYDCDARIRYHRNHNRWVKARRKYNTDDVTGRGHGNVRQRESLGYSTGIQFNGSNLTRQERDEVNSEYFDTRKEATMPVWDHVVMGDWGKTYSGHKLLYRRRNLSKMSLSKYRRLKTRERQRDFRMRCYRKAKENLIVTHGTLSSNKNHVRVINDSTAPCTQSEDHDERDMDNVNLTVGGVSSDVPRKRCDKMKSQKWRCRHEPYNKFSMTKTTSRPRSPEWSSATFTLQTETNKSGDSSGRDVTFGMEHPASTDPFKPFAHENKNNCSPSRSGKIEKRHFRSLTSIDIEVKPNDIEKPKIKPGLERRNIQSTSKGKNRSLSPKREFRGRSRSPNRHSNKRMSFEITPFGVHEPRPKKCSSKNEYLEATPCSTLLPTTKKPGSICKGIKPRASSGSAKRKTKVKSRSADTKSNSGRMSGSSTREKSPRLSGKLSWLGKGSKTGNESDKANKSQSLHSHYSRPRWDSSPYKPAILSHPTTDQQTSSWTSPSRPLPQRRRQRVGTPKRPKVSPKCEKQSAADGLQKRLQRLPNHHVIDFGTQTTQISLLTTSTQTSPVPVPNTIDSTQYHIIPCGVNIGRIRQKPEIIPEEGNYHGSSRDVSPSVRSTHLVQPQIGSSSVKTLPFNAHHDDCTICSSSLQTDHSVQMMTDLQEARESLHHKTLSNLNHRHINTGSVPRGIDGMAINCPTRQNPYLAITPNSKFDQSNALPSSCSTSPGSTLQYAKHWLRRPKWENAKVEEVDRRVQRALRLREKLQQYRHNREPGPGFTTLGSPLSLGGQIDKPQNGADDTKDSQIPDSSTIGPSLDTGREGAVRVEGHDQQAGSQRPNPICLDYSENSDCGPLFTKVEFVPIKIFGKQNESSASKVDMGVKRSYSETHLLRDVRSKKEKHRPPDAEEYDTCDSENGECSGQRQGCVTTPEQNATYTKTANVEPESNTLRASSTDTNDASVGDCENDINNCMRPNGVQPPKNSPPIKISKMENAIQAEYPKLVGELVQALPHVPLASFVEWFIETSNPTQCISSGESMSPEIKRPYMAAMNSQSTSGSDTNDNKNDKVDKCKSEPCKTRVEGDAAIGTASCYRSRFDDMPSPLLTSYQDDSKAAPGDDIGDAAENRIDVGGTSKGDNHDHLDDGNAMTSSIRRILVTQQDSIGDSPHTDRPDVVRRRTIALRRRSERKTTPEDTNDKNC